MNCCNQPMSDFSYYRLSFISKRGQSPEEKVPHFYCTKCGSHFHEYRTFTANEWFFYINEETYADHQRRQHETREAEASDMLESLHAHELINHSDPEKGP